MGINPIRELQICTKKMTNKTFCNISKYLNFKERLGFVQGVNSIEPLNEIKEVLGEICILLVMKLL